MFGIQKTNKKHQHLAQFDGNGTTLRMISRRFCFEVYGDRCMHIPAQKMAVDSDCCSYLPLNHFPSINPLCNITIYWQCGSCYVEPVQLPLSRATNTHAVSQQRKQEDLLIANKSSTGVSHTRSESSNHYHLLSCTHSLLKTWAETWCWCQRSLNPAGWLPWLQRPCRHGDRQRSQYRTAGWDVAEGGSEEEESASRKKESEWGSWRCGCCSCLLLRKSSGVCACLQVQMCVCQKERTPLPRLNCAAILLANNPPHLPLLSVLL